ncbi:MAG: H+-translocating transhydrogenase subunit beta [Bacteroidales bacterium]|jgi:NAD(P) transhydrogenase subunit beta|nr:H+-translocating transhydrogenase subunit beta [Bacteroidales bacterium]MDN5328787.1 H+-translocating transhydrogenase subunit beta [Bacteroidales bacterium]
METIQKVFEYSQEFSILEISYFVASVLFIVGLKKLSHPDTARSGNLWAAFGMGMAILFTILFHKVKTDEGTYEPIGNLGWIFGGLIIGSVVGWVAAKKVKMTAMPQMVSLFNGMGGACAALISLMEFPHVPEELVARHGMMNGYTLSVMLGLLIGSVSFAGSMIAFGKLNGNIGDIKARWLRYVNMALLAILLFLVVFVLFQPEKPEMIAIYVFAILALVYGVSFVMPIGGADMPVVISLLNSFTGVAAAMGGFLYDNRAMLTGGILVGSAGTILTILMCNAMNRSLLNVIVGAFGGSSAAGAQDVDKTVKEITLSDAAILLSYSQKVYIVPGYGLAVAQAQHLCHELDKLLADKGVEVKYGIHPVAGRMPGHMNVLLAEADVPYEKLVEAEDANQEMPNTDVVMVIGANDVVNPAAEEDPSSPIYGMPVLRVWEAKNVIVMKRSMAKGYAAIENNLFYHPRNRMLFGDAKATLQQLITEIKSL